MRDRNPSAFLLRGSILVVAFLTLWWFVLVNPLLFVLRCSGDFFGPLVFGGSGQEWIQESASGDWSFTMHAKIVLHDSVLHSFSFDIPRGDVATFTFSLPAFWAIALSISSSRRIRPILLGTLLVAVVETALLLIFVETSSLKVVSRLTGSHDAFTSWFIRFSEYLVTLVIPYVAPLIVSIALYPELREQILGAIEPVQALRSPAV
jgi:hypothetical protein